MKSVVCILTLFAAILFILDGTSAGEVEVKEGVMTVTVQNGLFKEVLNDIARQSGIDVKALKQSSVEKSVVSISFANLSLEVGIARLLNGWNYALNRDSETGRIKTLYIVSKRGNHSKVPKRDSFVVGKNNQSQEHTLVSRKDRISVVDEIPAMMHEQYEEDGRDTDWDRAEEESIYQNNDQNFQTEEELIAAAPPEVQEFIRRTRLESTK